MQVCEMNDRQLVLWCRNRRIRAQQVLSRSIVRGVACPVCGARAGERCWSSRREPCYRESNHLERVFEAIRKEFAEDLE